MPVADQGRWVGTTSRIRPRMFNKKFQCLLTDYSNTSFFPLLSNWFQEELWFGRLRYPSGLMLGVIKVVNCLTSVHPFQTSILNCQVYFVFVQVNRIEQIVLNKIKWYHVLEKLRRKPRLKTPTNPYNTLSLLFRYKDLKLLGLYVSVLKQ